MGKNRPAGQDSLCSKLHSSQNEATKYKSVRQDNEMAMVSNDIVSKQIFLNLASKKEVHEIT